MDSIELPVEDWRNIAAATAVTMSQPDLLTQLMEENRELRRQIADLTEKLASFIAAQTTKKEKKRIKKSRTQPPAEEVSQPPTPVAASTSQPASSDATPMTPPHPSEDAPEEQTPMDDQEFMEQDGFSLVTNKRKRPAASVHSDNDAPAPGPRRYHLSFCTARTITEFNFDVEHCPGAQNELPNFLSRNPQNDLLPITEDEDANRFKPISLTEPEPQLQQITSVELVQDILREQQTSDSIQRIISAWERYEVKDEYLHYRAGGPRALFVPLPVRERVLYRYHDGNHAGHPGGEETYRAISKRFWWPGITRAVRDYLRSCWSCAAVKREPNLEPHGAVRHRSRRTPPPDRYARYQHTETQYQVGDKVMERVHPMAKGQFPTKWNGPCTVVDTAGTNAYWIERSNGEWSKTHIHDMRPVPEDRNEATSGPLEQGGLLPKTRLRQPPPVRRALRRLSRVYNRHHGEAQSVEFSFGLQDSFN
ncbi:hypothetical protein FQR65_LT14579 [Abscondita terminalis]|nr:hypothetical protein FQR65_LT14579 [Abscondita terminalis]